MPAEAFIAVVTIVAIAVAVYLYKCQEV